MRLVVAAGVAALVGASVPVLADSKPRTKRASVSSSGVEGSNRSDEAVISANGRFIAFSSDVEDFVPGDANGDLDVYIHDRKTRKTKRVSVTSAEDGGEGSSSVPSISGNGRWVVFRSAASLVADDDNGDDDIYLRDRKTGTTRRVSVTSDGSQADGNSDWPSISPSGRFVAFSTDATLTGSDPDDGSQDIYVWDRKTKKTRRVSVNSAEEPPEPGSVNDAPAVSADGRFVMWESNADNLVPNDENSEDDLFVRDRERGRTTRASLTSSEGEIDGVSYPSMSSTGRYVAFESSDQTIVQGDTTPVSDVFVRDRKRGTTRRASLGPNGQEPDDFSGYSQISPDGRYVAFCSPAENIDKDYPNDDVFVRDMVRRKTKLISVGANVGNPAANGNCYPDISEDGRWVAWVSGAVSLVPDDTNGFDDIFFRGPYR